MSNPQAVLLYLMIVNVVSFIIFGLDKFRAKKNLNRVPEIWLFALTLLFGSVGTWSGMYFFHHKTKHLKFVIAVPLIFVAQVTLALSLLNCK